jgi:hypothetical protein
VSGDLVVPSRYHTCFWPPEAERAWSTSLETKKSLVLVCKLWHEWATEYLYHTIRIHHLQTIKNLANALKRSKESPKTSESYGWWTRELLVHGVVPSSLIKSDVAYDEDWPASLVGLFSYLPNLTSFMHQPANGRIFDDKPWRLTSGVVSAPFSTKLKNLVLRQILMTDEDESLIRIGSTCTALKSLTIARGASTQLATFGSLEHLTVILPYTDDGSSYHLERKIWELPQLKSLTTIVTLSSFVAGCEAVFKTILQSIGPQLHRLEILNKWEGGSDEPISHILVPSALSLCPNLTYLAYGMSKTNRCEVSSTSIKEMGLSIIVRCHPALASAVQAQIELHLEKALLPKLERITILDVMDMHAAMVTNFEDALDTWRETVVMCAEAGVRFEDYKGDLITVPASINEIFGDEGSDSESYVPSSVPESEEYESDSDEYSVQDV